MTPLVEARNLSKKYNESFALHDFSISIPKGSIYGLLGPNGAGKTTFIRMLNQITLPDSGEIFFDGKKLAKDDIKHIGYMPEERGLYKNMSIGDQLTYFAQLKGLSKKDAKKIIENWLHKLKIDSWWKKKVGELSKGMAQKIQFVATILHQPLLLIFDEPFSGFDPMNAALIKDEILELNAKGATIIFSTHRMDTVEELCDHVALINQSKKVLDGEIKNIKNLYKKDKYKIVLITQNAQEVIEKMKPFQPEKAEKKDNSLEIILSLTEDDAISNALNTLTSMGRLIHFSELIPTMNEIFISTVEKTTTL